MSSFPRVIKGSVRVAGSILKYETDIEFQITDKGPVYVPVLGRGEIEFSLVMGGRTVMKVDRKLIEYGSSRDGNMDFSFYGSNGDTTVTLEVAYQLQERTAGSQAINTYRWRGDIWHNSYNVKVAQYQEIFSYLMPLA